MTLFVKKGKSLRLNNEYRFNKTYAMGLLNKIYVINAILLTYIYISIIIFW